MMIACRRCGARLDGDARFCGECGAPLGDADVGRTVGQRYKLLERIGAGSLGVVYRAEQLGLGRKVAIKILPPEIKLDPASVERFRREGSVLTQLRSPHTLTTYETGIEPDGSFYIAMELSPGRSLSQVLRDEGPLEWPRVLRIMAGLCDSLGEAHDLGVIHRDVRPDNVLVEPRGQFGDYVRLLDFGLAKLLATDMRLSPAGQTVGTVEYSSPEQLLRQPLDARSDLYALGVLAYVLVTGRHPFPAARSFGDMVTAQIHWVPPSASSVRPGIPDDIDTILARCLEKDRERRYPDARALAATIGVILSAPMANTGETVREPERITGTEDTVIGARPTDE
jgi:serine/threonine-protein kinase